MSEPLAGPSIARGWRLSTTSNFRTFSASKVIPTETRLQRARRWLGSREPEPDVSTAVSSSKWVATCTPTEVRLYCLRDVDLSKEIKIQAVISLNAQTQQEQIQAIALSEDILAIITHIRLIVYEYRVPGGLDKSVDDRRIDHGQIWTPRSVAILQYKPGRGVPTAHIAVGGQGHNGVKLFRYAYGNCWSYQEDIVPLSCRGNTGSIKLVQFSADRMNGRDKFMVVGVTSSNQIHCWDLGHRLPGSPDSRALESAWYLDTSSRKHDIPGRGEITSASAFASPLGHPHIFCTVSQGHGSQLLRSFMAPLDPVRPGQSKASLNLRLLPQIGRRVEAGAVTPNGHFVLVLEEGRMRLLVVQASDDGDLTCGMQQEQPAPEWKPSSKGGAFRTTRVSINIQEQRGGFDIIAVDGKGHVVIARVSVPEMPETGSIKEEASEPPEMSGTHMVFQLSSEESGQSSRKSGSSTT
ncbi:hypothetical protein EJ04DRAFT_89134 [Polyplosphaeria fusca]|uniref:Uncharacterized protein n=1 Tax=Polyplosphaeria fusca TaxID=682080 RepID=A0A9P4QLT6_9PLEO|nr:hypothetical protein EJ04DRAFT_89134 [Polyplosphaeria fusca]